MSPEKFFSDFCLKYGFRNCSHRNELVREIFNLYQTFTINNLWENLSNKGFRVSKATVYRTLLFLEKAKMIRKKPIFA